MNLKVKGCLSLGFLMGLVGGVSFYAVLVILGVRLGVMAMGVSHGVSMEPYSYESDRIVFVRPWKVAVGDVIAFRVPDVDRLVGHRVVGIDENGCFQTKGDNNDLPDDWVVCEPKWKELIVIPGPQRFFGRSEQRKG